MESKITPIILCGGSGTRLWPLSRTDFPKQFLPILGEFSLFQQALLRLPQEHFEAPICVTNYEHRFIVSNQLRELGKSAEILLEPESRNTTAAIAAAVEFYLSNNGNQKQPLLILPADHYIQNNAAFWQACTAAKLLSVKGQIVTFGIRPQYPETGYGYIDVADNDLIDGGYRVKSFKEKPQLKTAQSYYQSGHHYWNSGLFLFQAKTIQQELQKWSPVVAQKAQEAVQTSQPNLNFHELGAAFKEAPSISIDYAIMEKTNKACMIPLDCQWSDVGSFKSLADIALKNADNNAIQGDAISIDSQHNYINVQSRRVVASIGINNVMIIDTDDALLIADKEKSQHIGLIVNELQKRNDPRAAIPSRVHRPWGWYEFLSSGKTFQVKRIHVYPNSSLSLQKHRYRSEHWVVIQGTADVHCDGQDRRLETNQSTFIPLAAVHRLGNSTNQPVEIIEVQNGEYLGEDDIIRLDDDYQRC